MLLPYDKASGRLYTRFLGFDSQALKAVEKLVGFSHENFSVKAEQTKAFKEVIYEHETVLITDILNEVLSWLRGVPKGIAQQIIKLLNVPKAIAAPILVDGQVEAVISVQSNELRTEDIPAIKAFAHNVSAAWERIKYIEQLEAEIKRRREIEDSLRESEERYRTLAEASPDMISVINRRWEIEYVNANAAKQFEVSSEELISKRLRDIFPKEVAKMMENFMQSVLDRKEAACVDGPIDFAQKKMWLNTWIVPILDKKGEANSILAISRDINDRKKTEDEIKESCAKLRAAFRGIVKAMSSLVEVKDPYTAGHQRRVADLSTAMTTEMGLSKGQIDAIRMAGSIHDIGKICIPAEILSKPGQLHNLEWDPIKTHPRVGYEILKDIEFPWPVAEIIHQHHEKLDGSGYPQGLKGEEIMIEARILAVADVIEAMAYHRPYRPALGVDKALDEIWQKKGILYDPQVVDICWQLFREKGYNFQE
ncbi:MAG: HD domain-containing protein [Candidatus Aminicenantes bacterium]|nr:HD domain-containing protein [Candidatus Aminicenantes bacterium]